MTPPANTRRVMARRHHGWEGASPGLLARIFGVSVQQATAIVAQRCATCGKSICGCTDAAWSGPRIAPRYAEQFTTAPHPSTHRIQCGQRRPFSRRNSTHPAPLANAVARPKVSQANHACPSSILGHRTATRFGQLGESA